MGKDREIIVVLKWLGMGLGVSGTIAAALHVWPLAPVLLILNCAVWTVVGRAWREPTVWITNAIAFSVSLVAFVGKLVSQAL